VEFHHLLGGQFQRREQVEPRFRLSAADAPRNHPPRASVSRSTAGTG
jgi:hypothetical protein